MPAQARRTSCAHTPVSTRIPQPTQTPRAHAPPCARASSVPLAFPPTAPTPLGCASGFPSALSARIFPTGPTHRVALDPARLHFCRGYRFPQLEVPNRALNWGKRYPRSLGGHGGSHWMGLARLASSPGAFHAECARLLRPHGRVALVWNSRVPDAPVNREAEAAMRDLVPTSTASRAVRKRPRGVRRLLCQRHRLPLLHERPRLRRGRLRRPQPPGLLRVQAGRARLRALRCALKGDI